MLLAVALVSPATAQPLAAGLPGATPLGDGSWAVPLVGEPPGWATPEVFARAVEASEDGLAWNYAASRAVVPALAPSQVLIRPGVQIFPESIFPGWCTAAFVFADGRQISTAGHCTKPKDRVLALTAPTTVLSMGTTISSTWLKSKPGSDQALISIDVPWRPFVDPATAIVGGPCGKTDRPTVPLLKYVGHGAGIGTGGTARLGLYDSLGLATILAKPPPGFTGIGPAYFGDSGGPVLEATQTDTATGCAAGAAVGILTHIQVAAEAVPTGFFFGTPIRKVGGGRVTSAALVP